MPDASGFRDRLTDAEIEDGVLPASADSNLMGTMTPVSSKVADVVAGKTTAVLI